MLELQGFALQDRSGRMCYAVILIEGLVLMALSPKLEH